MNSRDNFDRSEIIRWLERHDKVLDDLDDDVRKLDTTVAVLAKELRLIGDRLKVLVVFIGSLTVAVVGVAVSIAVRAH